jgi:hypothetical protein
MILRQGPILLEKESSQFNVGSQNCEAEADAEKCTPVSTFILFDSVFNGILGRLVCGGDLGEYFKCLHSFLTVKGGWTNKGKIEES